MVYCKLSDCVSELDNLGPHQLMVAVCCVELGEDRISGPFAEAICNVLSITGVIGEGSIEVVEDVREVKGIGLRRWKFLVEEGGDCSMVVRGHSASSDVSSNISPSPLYIPPHRH